MLSIKKYKYFDNKLCNCSLEQRGMVKENRDYWYDKYIRKWHI